MATIQIDRLLETVVKKKASDLHLAVGKPPVLRLHGGMRELQTKVLEAEDTMALMKSITPERIQQEFEETGSGDFGFAYGEAARFRVAVFKQKGCASMVLRRIPNNIMTFDQIGLPKMAEQICRRPRGIFLVTGPTGSGKSTTLAAMINEMNETGSKHIVTIEDPIEFLHRDKKSIINQREVGQDTHSFKRALRRVLRQDPDVILIGEMRDEETVHTALSAAETGHLVLSTVHTVDAPETINRVIDFFPPHMHQQVRAMLAGTLKGVISQRLVRSTDGGRVATCEILRMTGRVKDMIMDQDQTGRLTEVITEGGYYGMQTFDQALFDHVKAGRVSVEDAKRAATSPHDFKLLLAADGRRGTTMDDLADSSARNQPANAF